MRRTLEERQLLRPGDSVLVAVSGGPDSTALLAVLVELAPHLPLTLWAASVNHGLRPEAGHDVAVAAESAARLGVPFTALEVRVDPGASRQSQARKARYGALLTEAGRVGAARIAVGHTLDDQAETVLMRILRGTGVSGLRGIAPLREDGVIRPLLDCRRAEVHEYLEHRRLSFVADPSNLDRRYLRVAVRLDVLPLLTRINPQLPEQLTHLADDARDLAGAFEVLLARGPAHFDAGAAELRAVAAGSRAAFLAQPGGLRRQLLASWAKADLGGTPLLRSHLDALDRMMRDGGEVRLPGDVLARLDAQGRLLLTRLPKRSRGRGRPMQEREDEASTDEPASAPQPGDGGPSAKENTEYTGRY